MQLRTEASHNLLKAPSCTALTHTCFLACFAYHVGVVKNKGPAQVATTEIVICYKTWKCNPFAMQSKASLQYFS